MLNDMNSKIGKLFKNNIPEMLICLFVVGSLAFCITGDFNHDDLKLFYFRGREILEDCSFIDIIMRAQNAWIERGRLSTIALVWSYVIYYIFTDFQIYEVFLIFLTILDVVIFGVFVELFLKSKKYKLFSMIGISLFFQIYSTYHNVLVGYAGLLQLSVLLTFLQLIFLYKYLQNRKNRLLVISILCQIVSVMVYEFNYFNVLMVLCVLLLESSKIRECIKIMGLYSIPLFLLGSYSVCINVLAKQSNTIYGGSEVRFHVRKIADTMLKQLSATIPLFNFWNNKNGVLSGNLLAELNFLDFCVLAMLVMISIAIIFKFRDEKIEKPHKCLFFIGLILFLGPSILPSLTPKYQDELVWGIAHIAVFEQYFGLCLLVLLILVQIFNGIKKLNKSKVWMDVFRIITIGCMFYICIMNLAVENRYILYLQSAVKFPKMALEHALEHDILKDLDEYDILLIPQSAPYDSSAFYSQQTKKKIHVYTLDDLNRQAKSEIAAGKIYVLHKYGTKELEMVLLGEVSKINFDEQGNPSAYYVSEIKIYRNTEFNGICFEDQTILKSEMQLLENGIYYYPLRKPANFFEISVI